MRLPNNNGCIKRVVPFEALQKNVIEKQEQEDVRLGTEMWRKASIDLSDALIYITMPLLVILMTLILPPIEC